jgi:DegV family protein with EDD domain
MSIRIVTDSTCDLPPAVIAKYDIDVVPLYINIEGKGYLDGVEISREEFYRRLPDCNPAPTTAAASPEKYRQVYDALAQQGASEILSIHISPSLSAVVDTARLAAQATKSIPVTVLDSRQLSLGTGFLVEAAARVAALGASMSEIIAELEGQITRSHVFAALDTLEFLKRSGRMNGTVSAMGNFLQVKPLLRMFNGKPTAERVRTRERATQRLLELLHEVGHLERVAIVHTHAAERVAELRERAAYLLPAGEIMSIDITPVIGAHIGPGAVGFACVAARA